MADILSSTFGEIILQYILHSEDVEAGTASGIKDLADLRAVFLRHLLQLRCNSHAISTIILDDGDDGARVHNTSAVKLGSAIYPTVSLLNHSCYPNAILRLSSSSSTVGVHGSRDIVYYFM